MTQNIQHACFAALFCHFVCCKHKSLYKIISIPLLWLMSVTQHRSDGVCPFQWRLIITPQFVTLNMVEPGSRAFLEAIFPAVVCFCPEFTWAAPPVCWWDDNISIVCCSWRVLVTFPQAGDSPRLRSRPRRSPNRFSDVCLMRLVDTRWVGVCGRGTASTFLGFLGRGPSGCRSHQE